MKRNTMLATPYIDTETDVGNIGWHGYQVANEGSLYREKIKIKAASMCLLITVVSFLGFWVENIFIAIRHGQMNNRNMLLPFLFGYGLAIMAIYFLFGTPMSPKFFGIDIRGKSKALNILNFFWITFLCVSIGEIVLGTFVENSCGIVWWNYSNIPLHITKYTSVPTSMGFAFLITVFMGFFCEPLLRVFSKMNKKVLYTLAIIFMILLVGDFLLSAGRMFETHELMRIWKINLR